VVAHKMEKGLAGGELARGQDRVAVAMGVGLFEEGEAGVAGRGAIGLRVPGVNDDRDILDAGPLHLIQKNAEDRADFAIAVNQGLQRNAALADAGSGQDGFADFHRLEYL
jgi:hypothetical protein